MLGEVKGLPGSCCKGGWGDLARAQAEALLPAKAGEASGRWAGSSCLLFLLGCCEVSQGRKGSQPARGDYAVPHPGPETRGLRAQKEKASDKSLL